MPGRIKSSGVVFGLGDRESLVKHGGACGGRAPEFALNFSRRPAVRESHPAHSTPQLAHQVQDPPHSLVDFLLRRGRPETETERTGHDFRGQAHGPERG